MKDRSKIVSSLLISLLAGFIYYQLDDQPVLQSIKAALSDNIRHEETVPSSEPFRSLVSKEDGINKSKSRKYYIGKKEIKPVELVADNVSEKELISEFISEQFASSRKPVPDIEGYLASLITDEGKTVSTSFSSALPELLNEDGIGKLSLEKVYLEEGFSDLASVPGFFNGFKIDVKEQKEAEDYDDSYSYSYSYSTGKSDVKVKENGTKAPKIIKKNVKVTGNECEVIVPEVNVIVPGVNTSLKMKKIKIQVPDAKNNMIDVEIEVPEIEDE